MVTVGVETGDSLVFISISISIQTTGLPESQKNISNPERKQIQRFTRSKTITVDTAQYNTAILDVTVNHNGPMEHAGCVQCVMS
jgi:hypothetical protein